MRISDWSSDVCSSDLSVRNHAEVAVHLINAIVHELLQQSVLRHRLRRRHVDQARVIALIEMTILRVHHCSLSIADEFLAQILVQGIAVALELREFARPTLIPFFRARSFLAEDRKSTRL